MALVVSASRTNSSADALVEQLRPLAVVTGASGFIGRHLCSALQGSGYSVRALLRENKNGDPGPGEICADEVSCCALDAEPLSSQFEGASAVFHLAGVAHTGFRNERELKRVNVEGSKAVASACCSARVPRLIHFSSILAADPGQSAYAASKFASEMAVTDQHNGKLSVVILRPANVYGMGMQGNWLSLMRMIARGRVPPLPNLRNLLSLISVQDLCLVAIEFARWNGVEKGESHTSIITDGQLYTPNQIESAIYEALGKNKPTWHSPRMVFFAAAALAEFAAQLGLTKNGFGFSSYRNLVRNSLASDEAQQLANNWQEQLGFKRSTTFIDMIPELIAQFDKNAQSTQAT